ncbi:MAG: PD40 domain-containing protein, partial [Candidatus Eisenbacteria bacterium]|nr:PD40 domain-containing protein [Candidatus Eisenbacteria bacterium]
MLTRSFLALVSSCLFCVVFCVSVGHADELTIERICDAPDLSGPNLREVKISPDGAYVAFLKNRHDDSERYDLWVYTLAGKIPRMIVNCDSITAGPEALSDGEKAYRERKRVFATGIVDYSWSHDSRHLLFTLSGDVYGYDLTKPHPDAMTRLTETPEFETDARFSPKDSYVSFIRDD